MGTYPCRCRAIWHRAWRAPMGEWPNLDRRVERLDDYQGDHQDRRRGRARSQALPHQSVSALQGSERHPCWAVNYRREYWAAIRPYAREWRVVARAAGVPDQVWNMDARAGGISEADDAGAD